MSQTPSHFINSGLVSVADLGDGITIVALSEGTGPSTNSRPAVQGNAKVIAIVSAFPDKFAATSGAAIRGGEGQHMIGTAEAKPGSPLSRSSLSKSAGYSVQPPAPSPSGGRQLPLLDTKITTGPSDGRVGLAQQI